MNRTSYSGSACSVSPGQLKQRRAARKRLAAANFLQAVLGVSIPHDNDEAFRASLADGVVLCQLLNALQPGIIPHIQSGAATPTSGVRQTFENVSNFLEAAQKFTTDLFSAADLEEPGER